LLWQWAATTRVSYAGDIDDGAPFRVGQLLVDREVDFGSMPSEGVHANHLGVPTQP
jgi:hypothetical protein